MLRSDPAIDVRSALAARAMQAVFPLVFRGPRLMQLIRDTYFVAADLTDPLVSPSHYTRLAEFPPTLIMTAEFDTLRAEMRELAADMTAKGVAVTYKEF